jgi:hypothetical protein
MLNLGLIGDIQLLEPYTKKAYEHREIHIAGKSSVGTHPATGNFRISAPEFNRIELVERSDALFINRFSLLPFQMLCDMVKKSKHFFAASYPALNPDECTHLTKLAGEAKTVIQVANPFYYLPPVQWLNQNLKKPAYIEVTMDKTTLFDNQTLIQILLMLKSLTGNNPKKTGAVLFDSEPAKSGFTHFQLEYGDGTVLTVNLNKVESQLEFKIKTFAGNQFTSFDLLKLQGTVNHSPADLSHLKDENETDIFFSAIINKNKYYTSIEDYSTVLQTVQSIQSKLDRFIHL